MQPLSPQHQILFVRCQHVHVMLCTIQYPMEIRIAQRFAIHHEQKNIPTKFELTGKTIKQTNDSSQIFILLGFSCIYIPRHFFSFPSECRWSVSLMASYASAASYQRDHTQSTQQINSTTICHGQRMHRHIKINTDWSLVIFI